MSAHGTPRRIVASHKFGSDRSEAKWTCRERRERFDLTKMTRTVIPTAKSLMRYPRSRLSDPRTRLLIKAHRRGGDYVRNFGSTCAAFVSGQNGGCAPDRRGWRGGSQLCEM